MDERRHSIDFPLSRTLVALRRVRSLRDPSTNSMGKLSALVDNLNWETKSSNAIVSGFHDGCNGGKSERNAAEFRSSSLFMSNNHNASDLEMFHSSRICDSGRLSRKCKGNLTGKIDLTTQNCTKGSGACPSKQGKHYKGENGGAVNVREVEEGFGFNSTLVSGDSIESDSIESGDFFDDPGNCLKHSETGSHRRLKHKCCNRNNRRTSRVIAEDVFSRVVSPCLSTSDTTKEVSHSGLSLYKSDDFGMINFGHRGCGISSCLSRTLKLREPNLQGQPDVEECPLLLENSSIYKSMDCQHYSEGSPPYLESPRNLCQKFMPKSFKELVGQDVVASSLTNAITSGRIASLYLFHGPRGVGKTSAARAFVAALNCSSSKNDKPCGVCQDCLLFFSGRSRDVKEVHSVVINSTKRFRSFIKDADCPLVYSRFKVYIIDEGHLLQGKTWAMMLNKLEGLPRYAVFIIITPNLDMLPCSVVSKSQRYHFQLVKEVDIVCQLGKICADEGLEFEEDALNLIATNSSGSLRDATMMLDHLSLLGKKITMPLVYEVSGVVSDDELLDLLRIALSSDASNTVKRAKELMRSRIDPLQLISQLANLIMDILAGNCKEGNFDIRRKFFRTDESEAKMQQLSNALKVLSETEKQLKMSKNQTTWLTVALLQLGSVGVANDGNDPRLSLRTIHPQDGEFLGTASNRECLMHPVTSSHEMVEPGNMGDAETFELIWNRAVGGICESSSLKNFLTKQGKLVSVSLTSGVVVAELEFDHSDHVSKAEKSWKVIAGALQQMLGYNIELRINLAKNGAVKSKKPYLSLLLSSCSRRLHLHLSPQKYCRSNAGSESSSYTVITTGDRNRYELSCNFDCASQITQAKEMVTSIRNSDGNALSLETSYAHKKDLRQSRQRGCSWNWKCKMKWRWRRAKFPFPRVRFKD